MAASAKMVVVGMSRLVGCRKYKERQPEGNFYKGKSGKLFFEKENFFETAFETAGFFLIG